MGGKFRVTALFQPCGLTPPSRGRPASGPPLTSNVRPLDQRGVLRSACMPPGARVNLLRCGKRAPSMHGAPLIKRLGATGIGESSS